MPSLLLCQQKELRIMICLLCRMLWYIWKQRNEAVFNLKNPDPHALILKARMGANEFWSTLAHETLTTEGTAPPNGSLKINCDGSYLAEDLCAAIGECVTAQAAFVAELSAVRKAILLCIDLDLDHLLIETDNADLFACLS